ncbi:MAG: hypothetical protein OEY09_17600 [Gammaproteobacteria bacterium]|nr:hypothetical protein [Gammaproteobacteria bacterium]
MKFIYLLPLLAIFGFSNVHAGVYSDALGKCFIDSTTSKDRNILIVWIFSAASQHPVVKDILTVSEDKLESANRDFADLTMKLLTVDCKTETEKAIEYEGNKSLEESFNVFGQVAGRELFSSPHVAAAMAGYAKHLDSSKLEEMLKN